jgi:Fe-S-cluster-containing dehydrogenase component
VVFTASSATYDGRYANNGWLQETPDFMTKLTWDNAALMSPRTARALGVKNEELIRLTIGDRELELPAMVHPGQAPFSISVALGYGRTRAGVVGGDVEQGVAPVGFDSYRLRTSDGMYVARGARVTGTGRTYTLATTQEHWKIDTRGMKEREYRATRLVRQTTLAKFKEEPNFVAKVDAPYPDIGSPWQEWEYDGYKWGMATDMTKCVGCNSCVVACTSENNVPVVGKDNVANHREMHWIRIDRYFTGDAENPQVSHQPVACQHCENAPCETVCPVGATIHSSEGLNEMTYNRCIGTRYCANNCPYKVRRFNYLNYQKGIEEARNKVRQLVFNPEVTVRSRGVMEKCTFCVQRITARRIEANNARERIEDGEIQTACQQACPTGAIVFGDLNDEKSRVRALHERERSYKMLWYLNTEPRNVYLARIRNPHPDLG